jgi:hypothetical protein
MSFLKPTKITWITFFVLIALNSIPLIVWNAPSLKHLNDLWIILPLSQIFGLIWLSDVIGIDARGPGGDLSNILFPIPNFLGWMLIIIGNLITLAIYYLIASVISKFMSHYKNHE